MSGKEQLCMHGDGTICPFGVSSPNFKSICWSSSADLTTEAGTICPFGVLSRVL